MSRFRIVKELVNLLHINLLKATKYRKAIKAINCCSMCEYYFANIELDKGLCRLDKFKDGFIDLDNSDSTVCKDFERWSLI